MKNIYLITKYLIFLSLLSFCSVQLQQNQKEITTTTELSFCEKIEVEYVNYSNILLESSWELNQFIDDISPDSMDDDRDKFFDDMEYNYKYKEVYIYYLETRVEYLTKIYDLIVGNLKCEFPNDQSISIDQVQKAQDDLDAILSK